MTAKAYTGLGDEGTTKLITCKEVAKDILRIDAYGDVDELNSFVGLARAKNKDKTIGDVLDFVQNGLFQLCSDIATPIEKKVAVNIIRISEKDVKQIEKFTDDVNDGLPEIKNFVVFENSELAALLNVCRTISRRAERKIVTLARGEQTNHNVLRFINRLSSLFWVLARYVTKVESKKEMLWKPNN